MFAGYPGMRMALGRRKSRTPPALLPQPRPHWAAPWKWLRRESGRVLGHEAGLRRNPAGLWLHRNEGIRPIKRVMTRPLTNGALQSGVTSEASESNRQLRACVVMGHSLDPRVLRGPPSEPETAFAQAWVGMHLPQSWLRPGAISGYTASLLPLV